MREYLGRDVGDVSQEEADDLVAQAVEVRKMRVSVAEEAVAKVVSKAFGKKSGKGR